MDVTDVSKHTRVLAYLKEAEGLVAQKKKSQEKFEDVYKGIPYFDVFAKQSIEKSMNKWKQKDPYETIEEYKNRVNEETAKVKQQELQENPDGRVCPALRQEHDHRRHEDHAL